MIKKILGFLAILVIAVVVAINIHANSNNYGLSDISLDNVEVLAKGEDVLSCCEYTCWIDSNSVTTGTLLTYDSCWNVLDKMCIDFAGWPCQ